MKRKYNLLRILPALLFIVIFHHDSLCGQALEGKPRINFRRIAKTSDVIYINDSTYFLMDRSPLEKFPDYKELYDDKVKPYGKVYAVPGWSIDPDSTSNYMVDWYLQDSLLLMSDILPNISFYKIEDIFPNNELYKRMEELTGIKFDKVHENRTSYTYKEYKYNKHNLIAPPGAMPAIWFSDTIIVKRAANYEENIYKWINIPCRELIFKNGKLISNRIKEGMY